MKTSEFTANRELARNTVSHNLAQLARLQALHGALRAATPHKPAPARGAYDARQRLMRLEGFDPYNTAGAL